MTRAASGTLIASPPRSRPRPKLRTPLQHDGGTAQQADFESVRLLAAAVAQARRQISQGEDGVGQLGRALELVLIARIAVVEDEKLQEPRVHFAHGGLQLELLGFGEGAELVVGSPGVGGSEAAGLGGESRRGSLRTCAAEPSRSERGSSSLHTREASGALEQRDSMVDHTKL